MQAERLSDSALPTTRLVLGDIGDALRAGRLMFLQAPRVSVAYAALFTLFGLMVLGALGAFGVSPLALPFAGGFMLLGPVLLSGYFKLAHRLEQHHRPRLADAFTAFSRAPMGLWLVALICAFLFLIWITDAGILYSFTIGEQHLPYDLSWRSDQGSAILRFTFWGSLMGSVLAYMIFAISAFSVPLIHERRAGAVQGIHASVRTVLGNFRVCLAWGLVLSGVILLSILLLPLLLVTLPVMSYASFALYRRAFPALSAET